MRILVVSDHEEQRLYEYFDPDRWVGKIDLTLSCGDLRSDYLSYLVTVLRVPLLYVAGNHDSRYRTRPPEGCDDIDCMVARVGGLRIAGLAGCYRYNDSATEYQFTERQIRRRLRKLRLAVWRAGGVDLVISHAAPSRCPFYPGPCPQPAGLGLPCIRPHLPDHPDPCPEAIDPAHRAVLAYNAAIAHWKPRWWLHGHNHVEYGRVARLWWVGDTQVINADGHVVLDTAQPVEPERGSLLARL